MNECCFWGNNVKINFQYTLDKLITLLYMIK